MAVLVTFLPAIHRPLGTGDQSTHYRAPLQGTSVGQLIWTLVLCIITIFLSSAGRVDKRNPPAPEVQGA